MLPIAITTSYRIMNIILLNTPFKHFINGPRSKTKNPFPVGLGKEKATQQLLQPSSVNPTLNGSIRASRKPPLEQLQGADRLVRRDLQYELHP